MSRSAKIFTRFLTAVLIASAFVVLSTSRAIKGETRPTITTEADFNRAFKEVSNWGRWGQDDELGSSNLITPAKRKQAAALVKDGITVSLAHDVVEETAPDATTILKRTLLNVTENGSSDQYEYSGTYHGIIHSHLDAVNCHYLVNGKGYNGRGIEDLKAAQGCAKGGIYAQRNGIVTRGVIFDATLLPGKASPQGWLEPKTAIHREDLEALEKIQHVKVSPGDVILLHTGRWKRRAALGAWNPAEGYAGYHADVAYFLKERGVAFIGGDAFNDVGPSGVENVRLPLHGLALASMGISIFDNLDLADVAAMAKKVNRYEFLFTAAPLRVVKGTGSPLNPIATF